MTFRICWHHKIAFRPWYIWVALSIKLPQTKYVNKSSNWRENLEVKNQRDKHSALLSDCYHKDSRIYFSVQGLTKLSHPLETLRIMAHQCLTQDVCHAVCQSDLSTNISNNPSRHNKKFLFILIFFIKTFLRLLSTELVFEYPWYIKRHYIFSYKFYGVMNI